MADGSLLRSEVRHGGRCRPTMLKKQVSGPLKSLDSPSWPPRPSKVERTLRKTWSRARYEVNVPYTIRDDEAAALLDDLCAERAARRAKAPTDPRRIVLGGEPCEAVIEGEGHRL
jgi:hypothetical protein